MQQSNYDHVGRNFGAAVAAARSDLGLSQRALAARLVDDGLQIDASGLSRLESGGRTPRLDEAVALANALGTQLSSMLAPGVKLGTQVSRAASRLEAMRDQLIDQMEEYNRLRLELAFAADDLILNPEEADTQTKGDSMAGRVMSLMNDGPLDVAARYELNHSDAPALDDERDPIELFAAVLRRDRSNEPAAVEPHTGSYLRSTLYRGSDNSALDRERIQTAREE
ncbi:helix-turn-helix transcriptional regulator [Agrococcus sp. SL85]|uniref:helix-turn-helix domain-containing protein n=1 Tax=Agrococcus sp. SL85 TaxID=2995141 RepID=UPI00226CB514|nr:helix-turn-helix transcriptional regulator [Agrococcus sp. SL85]WAC65753.1 helix-turn-helix transcriptional regulator [Agrococcus sp. SL85]